MMPFRLPSLLFLGVLALLVSCSQENSTNLKNESVDKQFGISGAVQEVPQPNPATMEEGVAELLESSWTELNAKLIEDDSTLKSKAQAYADYGLVAFGNGLVLPAEIAFENATILAPNDERWIYFRALVYEYKGMLEKAVISFQRVLEMRPEYLPALIRLADVRYEQALLDDAHNLYRQVLTIESDSATAYYGLGRVASAKGMYKEAVKHFESALELQPNADRINYFLGLAWRNLDDREKAQSFLAKRGTNEPHFTDPLFDTISGGEARIGGLWAHLNAGSQAFVDGNYVVAVEEFRQATDDHPNDPRSWQSLGMGLKNIGDNKNALSAYRKALNISNNNAVVHHELAKLLIVTGNLKEAEKHLLYTLEIDPRMIEAHTILASLLNKTERAEEALKRYDIALALDTQSAELAISRAETLVTLKRSSEAVNALAESVSINPLDSDLRIAYGLTLAEVGKTGDAMAEIKHALDDSENDYARCRAHYAIGRVFLQLGDAQAAISSFGDALKLNPKHRAAGIELARSFLRLRNFEQALGVYEVLIKHWPDNDATRIEAAKVALQLGNGAKARHILEEGVVKDSASSRLLGSLARLLVLSTQDDVEDPNLAIKYAQAALEKTNETQHHETLALCFAALGDFDQAIKLQGRLINNVSSSATAKIKSRMDKNLQRYKSKTLGRLPFDAS